MTKFVFFLITLAVATAGAFLFLKLRIPAGSFIGAMLAAVVLNLLCQRSATYSFLSPAMQLVSGAMIGSKVGKTEVLELKQIIVPTLLLLLGMVCLNLFFGVAICLCSDLDVATALFATTPGGVADMALISEQLGANSAYVAVMQCCRTIIIYTLCPSVFRFVLNRRLKKQPLSKPAQAEASVASASPARKAQPLSLLGLLLSAAAGGFLFNAFGIAAGMIMGAVIGSAAFCIAFGKVYFPKVLTHALLIVCGAHIASQITMDTLRSIPELLVPLLIEFVGIFAFIFLLSTLLNRFTKLDYATCLFASAPGGVQEMAVLSDEFGADSLKVAVMQMTRLVFVISFFPIMIQWVIFLVQSIR